MIDAPKKQDAQTGEGTKTYIWKRASRYYKEYKSINRQIDLHPNFQSRSDLTRKNITRIINSAYAYRPTPLVIGTST